MELLFVTALCLGLLNPSKTITPRGGNQILINIFSEKSQGNVISMENMILHVILNDPTDQIESVELYSSLELEYQSAGCGTSNCSFDCSSLLKRTYKIFVYTASGDVITETVDL